MKHAPEQSRSFDHLACNGCYFLCPSFPCFSSLNRLSNRSCTRGMIHTENSSLQTRLFPAQYTVQNCGRKHHSCISLVMWRLCCVLVGHLVDVYVEWKFGHLISHDGSFWRTALHEHTYESVGNSILSTIRILGQQYLSWLCFYRSLVLENTLKII